MKNIIYALLNRLFVESFICRIVRLIFNFQFSIFNSNRALFIGLSCALLIGCSQNEHFISKKEYRERTEDTFNAKKTFFADTTLFSVFNSGMTQPEREAMTFLYAYMPIGDIADYNGDFYLKNVRSSFEAKKEMPWGKDIPEAIFRHFVLPVRVNNENLDESRMVFYEELKDRVRNLSLYDAVLEVNHWCHEKVVYSPSDARTSSPLASVRSAYGRCGEESTFSVAALRSVGIPARQIYTPRWAHTDDNHAWVEAWVDGEWLFMGACEPEPVLNLGWFNAPASRGMLMHTKVFGDYDGPEEVMEQTDCYTEINIIGSYVPAAKATVKVVNTDGSPVKGALVEFKLYNYAEFFTVARKTTDEDGKCSLSAGKGDMLVWATKDGLMGFRKLSFGNDENLTIVLDNTPNATKTIELDIVPPVEGKVTVEVSKEQKEENERRLQEENTIRNNYVATFYSEGKAMEAAKAYNFIDKGIFIKSRGNYAQIEKFLREAPDSMEYYIGTLLSVVSDKDLRDTPAEVFLDHLKYTPGIAKNLIRGEEKTHGSKTSSFVTDLYNEYMLNPRIANELITSYKKDFSSYVDKQTTETVCDNPEYLVEWVKDNIKVRDDLNPQNIPIMPSGVLKARIADTHSRNIFFIAAARSLGIPARIEQATKKVQYYDNKWIDVNFDQTGQVDSDPGYITATYKPVKNVDNPKYYNHFTIAKVLPDASLQTLDFDSDSQTDMGEGNTWRGLMQKPLALDEGNYTLVSGMRMASGKVLARMSFFNVVKDKTTSIELIMRESLEDVQVIGSIDAETKGKFIKAGSGEEISILNATGRGYFILGILGAKQEPTNHAMRDIANFKNDFEKWNRGIVILFKNEQSLNLFDKNEFGVLPSTITYGIDASGAITNMVAEEMNLPNPDSLPIFIIADTFGRVVFISQGYTIGLGEQLLKVIGKL